MMKQFHNINMFHNKTFNNERVFVFVQLQPCNKTSAFSHEFHRRLVLRGPCCLQCLCRASSWRYKYICRSISGDFASCRNEHCSAQKAHDEEHQVPDDEHQSPDKEHQVPDKILEGGSTPPTKK